MRQHLTEISVRALKPVPGQQVKVWDTSTPGFGVRVNGRTKSWIVMYGKRRQLKVLGRFPDMPLSKARTEAKKLLLSPTEAPTVTFREALQLFLETHAKQHHSERTRKEAKRLLEKHYASLHQKRMREIAASDVAEVIDSLLDRPSEAAHAFRAGRVLFRWALGRGYIDRSPFEKMPAPAKDCQRERVLTDNEVRALWHTAEEPYGAIFKLLLLTGQRRGQVGGLKWDWVDGDKIHFPAEVMKAKKPHTLPIGELAQSIIDDQEKRGPYVFPGRWDTEKHFNGWGKLKREHDKRAGVTDYVIHDLRRTFASNLQKLGIKLEVIEKLLAHTSGSFGGIVGLYQRHAYMEEMREAMAAWEEYLKRLIAT